MSQVFSQRRRYHEAGMRGRSVIRAGVIGLAGWVVGSMTPLVAHDGVRVSELTAEETLLKAINDFNAGNYKEAVAGFQKFEADYGRSEQGRAAMTKARYPLAMGLLHLQKFDEALEVIEEALKQEPAPTAAQKEDLVFYKGVSLVQTREYGEARKVLAEFMKEFPNSKQAEEALLLAGTTFLLEDNFAEAAKHFGGVKSRMNPVNRGRAVVLELYSLLQEDQRDAALALVVEEFPRMDEMLQVAAFQMLALQLGSTFLEEKQYRKAIQTLQRVWSKKRLIDFQEQRLTELEEALEAVEAQPAADPYRKFQLKQMIAKVERELDNLQKIESFDAALRLRLATAFQAMGRYREAALIMEAMLAEMEPDPVVESASVNLVQSWSAIERWPKAIAAAKAFEEKFPKSDKLPLVLYLQGIAEQQANDQAAAIATFERIQKAFPKSDFAPRAKFMEGFSRLLAEQNQAAIAVFEEFAQEYPEHALAEPAAYWCGMGYSLDKQFERTREVMDEYLAKYPEGPNRGLAEFRRAYAAQSLKDYQTAIREFLQYLQKHPHGESSSEALLLLGDAYMAQGDLERGIAALSRIPDAEPKFFEEGYFKIGKAYRLLEESDRMREHFEKFVGKYPRSSRVGEAIYWIGWAHRQNGDIDRAREAYWTAIREYGTDPSIRTVDDLFPALRKLYSGGEEAQYLAALRELEKQATADDEPTLAMRALWAQGQFFAKSDPDRMQNLHLRALVYAEPSTTNPLLMADFADALERAGRPEEAEKMWRDLVKWNPRATQKDRALWALGRIEEARGNEALALAHYDRFEAQTVGSLLFGKVMLAKAALLEKRRDFEGAKAALDALLASSHVPGQEKAEALYRIGSMYLAQKKPELAVPYFQRIYIMHTRWQDWVAKAYLSSGEAFEQLQDLDAARRTYEELTQLETLRDTPESGIAKKRLEAMGGQG